MRTQTSRAPPAATTVTVLASVAVAFSLACVGAGQAVNNATTTSSQQPGPSQLQAQLGQFQQQAQRQLNQLNGLVMSAVSGNSSTGRYSNVLDAISNVGKAIQQQISASNQVNIVSSSNVGESANNKKNEYQSIAPAELAGLAPPPIAGQQQQAANYREQGEILRREITRRAGQLQQVVASSMDLLKNNGDMIMRRLLEQMNVRLDQAKAKADKIIGSEPVAMNEVTVKALATINAGLNNLNSIIANIVNRMDLANKQDQQQQQQQQRLGLAAGVGQTSALESGGFVSLQQRLAQAAADPQLPQLLDTNRFKANLQQLSQQFQLALNGSNLHQHLAQIRNQRLQQLAALGGGGNPAKASAPGGAPVDRIDTPPLQQAQPLQRP